MNGKHRMNNGSGLGHNNISETYTITGNKVSGLDEVQVQVQAVGSRVTQSCLGCNRSALCDTD